MRDTTVELELCQPAPFMFGDNGHLGVTDGERVWIVVVTCEALRATAEPQEASVSRLTRYAELYREMAEGIVSRGADVGGKVWIMESSILALMSSGKTRRSWTDSQNIV
jgi:hypothetical protein